MRILVDTNILISAFVLTSPRILALMDTLAQEHTIVLPSYGLKELRRVTWRKFPQKERQLEQFLCELPFERTETPAVIDVESYPDLRDRKDLPILLSAILADVDILLSGDADFAPLDLHRPEILTPRAFCEKYG
ncbi:MAG: PIN domain-containing protein [Oscillospiraceae bacterium]|jgi:predicted nucleic acid-binding protein|nr:PIN domain-containing protein [Oscillospiraceae bacterium]